MTTAFSFRLTLETTWDEKNGWPILSLILGTMARTSVGERSTNEAKTHRPGFTKLTAGGSSDSVVLGRDQPTIKLSMFAPVLALHNLLRVQARSPVTAGFLKSVF